MRMISKLTEGNYIVIDGLSISDYMAEVYPDLTMGHLIINTSGKDLLSYRRDLLELDMKLTVREILSTSLLDGEYTFQQRRSVQRLVASLYPEDAVIKAYYT